jgi:hypothetical protein
MKKIESPKVEAPRFLVDLYRDLRDRRLLLPSLLLVIALVAVPVGLSQSSSSVPPAPLAQTGSGKPTSAEPAVLMADSGIRSYRRRLAELKSKNPFTRHFALPKAPADKSGALVPPASPSTPGDSSALTPPSGEASVAPPATTGPSTQTTTTTRTVTVPQHVRRPHRRFFANVIDVKVGRPGDLTKRVGIKHLTVLPHDSRPVAIFLGTTTNGAEAGFSVSSDVSAVDTTGACVPAPDACQYLTLKPGDEARLDYDLDGNTYVLKVLAIRRVEVHPNRRHDGPGQQGHYLPSADLGPGVDSR